MTTFPVRRLVPWAAGLGFALLLAPTVAGDVILTIADKRRHRRRRLRPASGSPAWRRLGLPRLLGLDRRAGGLAWHIEGDGLLSGGDAWIGLDGRPRSVQLRESNLYPKGTPEVIVSTYTYDGFHY